MIGVSPRKFALLWLVGCLLALPFPVVARAASGWVGPLSEVCLALLRPGAAALEAATRAEAPSSACGGEVVPGAAPTARAETAKPAHRGRVKAPKPVLPSLLVTEAMVLRLAQSGARPHGSFVPETAEHPAGLRLGGVAPLGIGVQDGDILVEALGLVPRAPGEIVGAIIDARAKRVRQLSGTLWRQGQFFRITVQQPYLLPGTPS